MKIYFDMDGTLANFYAEDNWLGDLIAEKTTPYENARPLINMSRLAYYLNKLQREGNEIGVISWGSKKSSDEYLERIKIAKMAWLRKHLPSVKWNYVHITHYGVPKESFCDGIAILFDDEDRNRRNWRTAGKMAFNEEEIFSVLRRL